MDNFLNANFTSTRSDIPSKPNNQTELRQPTTFIWETNHKIQVQRLYHMGSMWVFTCPPTPFVTNGLCATLTFMYSTVHNSKCAEHHHHPIIDSFPNSFPILICYCYCFESLISCSKAADRFFSGLQCTNKRELKGSIFVPHIKHLHINRVAQQFETM